MKTSLCVVCRDREANLMQALDSWLACDIDEIVILDYGSKVPLVIDKPKVRLVRVEAPVFSMAISYNICIGLATGELIIKADSDHVFTQDFITALDMKPGEFISGTGVKNWIDGFAVYFKCDWEKVNGYNERLRAYGYDDIDIYKRLTATGLKHRRVNPEFIEHLEHSHASRVEGFGFVGRATRERLARSSDVNEQLCKTNPWLPTDRRTTYNDV